MQVLVIIVSATLTVFLVVSVIALVKIIQVLNDIKRITAKAERIADQAETVGNFFQNSAGSAAIVKLVSNIVQSFKSKKGKK